MLEYLGLQSWMDTEDFVRLVFRLTLDLAMTAIVVHGAYRRLYGHNDYPFAYYAFNVITFSVCFLLRKVPTDLGFALGLFAVFGVLRYRTEQIGIRDLTYLFIVIGLAVINATANKKVSFAELMLVDTSIVALVFLLEWAPGGRRERSLRVTYDDLERLRASDPSELLQDLSERTGLEVTRVSVLRTDLLRDTAELTVYYLDPRRKERT